MNGKSDEAGQFTRLPQQPTVRVVFQSGASMKIGIFCEESGAIRDQAVNAGLDAWSIDILPGRGEHVNRHIQAPAEDMLREKWDFIIAHPPCDYLANSGVRWLDRDIERWKKMYSACQFFKLFIDYRERHKIPVAIENPVMHKYAKGWIGEDFNFSFHPHYFGESFQKLTCIWTGGSLPPLKRTHWLEKKQIKQESYFVSPGPLRKQKRSQTKIGVAKAIVEQWLIAGQ